MLAEQYVVPVDAQRQALHERTPEGRIVALDALRGVAALVVVFHHFRNCFLSTEPRWFLRPLFAGRSAVIVFFVLSGYVLSIPTWRGRQPAYGRFLLRRSCRIYVPFVAAALLAFLVGRHFLYSNTGLGWWFHQTWQTPMTAGFLLRQILTVPEDAKLNTAFWSLRYEFEMSLVFPFVCAALLRLGAWRAAILAVLAWKGVTFAAARHRLGPAEVAVTLHWALCFILGALLSMQRAEIGAWYRRLPREVRWPAALVVLTALFVDNDVLRVAAACGLLVLVEHGRMRTWLTTRVPEYLGRISYSMYLVHGTVLWALVILLVHRVPTAPLAVLYLATVLVVSHLFCLGVEEPCIRIAKHLTVARATR